MPLLFLVALTYAEYLVEERPFWEIAVNIGWDMAILAVGFTGGLFSDKSFLESHSARAAVLLTSSVMAIDLICALVVLSFKKRKRFERKSGMISVGLGVLVVGIPVGLLIWS